jgi:anthranilate phosphoribosyltransferase
MRDARASYETPSRARHVTARTPGDADRSRARASHTGTRRGRRAKTERDLRAMRAFNAPAATATRGAVTTATRRRRATTMEGPSATIASTTMRARRWERARGCGNGRAGRAVVARATARRAAVDLRKVIEDLCEGADLSEEDAHAAMEALLDADPTQIAAFLVLLRAKGETASEMAGLARAMQSRAVTVDAGDDVLDIVGTGGDDAGTVNISTGSCVLAAAAGAKVAKHGSRSVSSLCGSGDVLEALGVDIELGPESMKRCVEEVGVGFMFAPRYHPAMAKVSPVRKALKVRTAFNMLGPMLNPAHSKYALVGVYSTGVQQLMADSLMKLGMKKALIVHSMGLDELTPAGPADVVEVTPSGTRAYTFEPKDVDIKPCTLEDLRGGDPTTNARILRAALEGEKGPVAETLILNAGVAMAAAQQAKDVVEGIAMAREAHESGKAGKTLDSWIKLTQELRKTEA